MSKESLIPARCATCKGSGVDRGVTCQTCGARTEPNWGIYTGGRNAPEPQHRKEFGPREGK